MVAPVRSSFCDKFQKVYAAKFEDVMRPENDPSKFLQIPFDKQSVNAQLSERFSRQLTAREYIYFEALLETLGEAIDSGGNGCIGGSEPLESGIDCCRAGNDSGQHESDFRNSVPEVGGGCIPDEKSSDSLASVAACLDTDNSMAEVDSISNDEVSADVVASASRQNGGIQPFLLTNFIRVREFAICHYCGEAGDICCVQVECQVSVCQQFLRWTKSNAAGHFSNPQWL